MIKKVEAIPVSLPRDLDGAIGTAGLPAALRESAGAYRWSSTVPAIYSDRLETTLVRITLDDGRVGWGEAQAPVAPRVSAAIVNDILTCVVEGQPFDGSRESIEHLWDLMFQSMRVRGQTGGFMLDAISGVDLALWDLAGKIRGLPVARLIRDDAATVVPAYLSGVNGVNVEERIRYAALHYGAGIRLFKIFFDQTEADLLQLLDALQAELPADARFAVDALWRLEWPADRGFLEQLAARRIHWLEAPFQPDDPQPHRELGRELPELPLALGESYRTRREMSWFLDEGLIRFVQPDLGRSGITGSLRIADAAARAGIAVAPHVSIALGPQIAAAIHLCAGVGEGVAPVCEFNPKVFEAGNRLLRDPLEFAGCAYRVPTDSGLGIALLPPDTTAP